MGKYQEVKDQKSLVRELFRNYESIKDYSRQRGHTFIDRQGLEFSSLDLQLDTLKILPQDLREAFWLYVVEDKTSPAVAELLGCSQPTVLSRVDAACELLAKAIFN